MNKYENWIDCKGKRASEIGLIWDGSARASVLLSELIPDLKAHHSDLFWDFHSICNMEQGEIGVIFTRDCGSLFIDKYTVNLLQQISDWGGELKKACVFRIADHDRLIVEYAKLSVRGACEIISKIIEYREGDQQ